MEKYKFSTGLAVMRAQPMHIGHKKLIDKMLKECKNAVIILGSVQEQGTKRNPYAYSLRKKMIKKVYEKENRLKILGIFDINNPQEWGNFVLDFLSEALPDIELPQAYYAGSEYDAQWFREVVPNIIIEDRIDYDFPYVSGSMVRDMIEIGDKRWHNFVPREIHQIIEEEKIKQKGVLD